MDAFLSKVFNDRNARRECFVSEYLRHNTVSSILQCIFPDISILVHIGSRRVEFPQAYDIEEPAVWLAWS
jgi:hypothetical protein